MNIAIDFGNSLAKAAIFEEEKLISFHSGISAIELLKLTNQDVNTRLILCNVGQESTHFYNLVDRKERLSVLDYHTKIPITNSYQTPETLGMDRLAGVIGANCLYPDAHCLVIDAGTCITYDFIDTKGEYYGGSISPGLQMRYDALHKFTAKLPQLKPDFTNEIDLVGRNTNEAITSGVQLGLINEVEGIIESYKHRFGDIKVLVCGGNTAFFESKIKHRIFAHPELVLVGLNRILLYNAHKA